MMSTFFRRRRRNREAQKSAEHLESVDERSQSVLPERLPSVLENAPTRKLPSSFSLMRSTYDSTTSASEFRDQDKAALVHRALSKNWSGVDEEEFDTANRTHPSNSPFFRSWIEQHQQQQRQSSFESPGQSFHDKPQVDSASQATSSQASVQVVFWRTWKLAVVVLVLAICLSVFAARGLLYSFGSEFQFCHKYMSPSRTPSRGLPFRDRYFQFLIYDDNTGRFGSKFEKGIMDAASLLRVSMNVQRSEDIRTMVKNIEASSSSLYDGVGVTVTEDPVFIEAIESSKTKTPMITVGSMESHLKGSIESIGYLGEQELEVGKLAAEKMKKAGMKTSLCLSRADNPASIHRCRGFKTAFGSQTYELNLNTMLQSELKSKLIPTILDDGEINGLFVADSRSFSLVYQILKSLNRLCSNKRTTSNSRCLYFGTYGTDSRVLQAIQKRELQFTIDPQEYLHGYLSTAWMMLASYGYPIPTVNRKSSFLLSRIVGSPEQIPQSTGHYGTGFFVHDQLRFRVFLLGNESADYIHRLKSGLRNAARDFDVHVEFHHYVDPRERSKCMGCSKNEIMELSTLPFDGYAFAASDPLDGRFFFHFDLISKSGKPYLTFGNYHSHFDSPLSSLHVGSDQVETSRNKSTLVKELDPALQGYLSILLLTLNKWYGQIPFGFLSTSGI